MGLYVCQLHAGHWYISAETNSFTALAMMTYQKPYAAPFETEAQAAQAALDLRAHYCALTISAKDFLKTVRLIEGVRIIGHIAYFSMDCGLIDHAQGQTIRNDQGMFGIVITAGRVASADEAARILSKTSCQQPSLAHP